MSNFRFLFVSFAVPSFRFPSRSGSTRFICFVNIIFTSLTFVSISIVRFGVSQSREEISNGSVGRTLKCFSLINLNCRYVAD